MEEQAFLRRKTLFGYIFGLILTNLYVKRQSTHENSEFYFWPTLTRSTDFQRAQTKKLTRYSERSCLFTSKNIICIFFLLNFDRFIRQLPIDSKMSAS